MSSDICVKVGEGLVAEALILYIIFQKLSGSQFYLKKVLNTLSIPPSPVYKNSKHVLALY